MRKAKAILEFKADAAPTANGLWFYFYEVKTFNARGGPHTTVYQESPAKFATKQDAIEACKGSVMLMLASLEKERKSV
jgi:hypothetical protein